VLHRRWTFGGLVMPGFSWYVCVSILLVFSYTPRGWGKRKGLGGDPGERCSLRLSSPFIRQPDNRISARTARLDLHLATEWHIDTLVDLERLNDPRRTPGWISLFPLGLGCSVATCGSSLVLCFWPRTTDGLKKNDPTFFLQVHLPISLFFLALIPDPKPNSGA
jgi:hypothetical protein